MKRLIVSTIVVGAFVMYAVFSRGEVAAQATTTTASQDVVASAPASTSSSTGTGAYRDGSYTGSQADAMYGTVQVQVVVQNGHITDVQFLNHPSGRRQSEEINNRAIPILTQEAISSQSAQVQVVSGATLTSLAFMQSLQAALAQA